MKTLSLAAVAVLVGLCTAQAQKTGRPNYDQLLRPPGAQFYHVPIATCEDYPEETTTPEVIHNDMEMLKRAGIKTLRISFG